MAVDDVIASANLRAEKLEDWAFRATAALEAFAEFWVDHNGQQNTAIDNILSEAAELGLKEYEGVVN
jgi:hypothetical protein